MTIKVQITINNYFKCNNYYTIKLQNLKNILATLGVENSNIPKL